MRSELLVLRLSFGMGEIKKGRWQRYGRRIWSVRRLVCDLLLTIMSGRRTLTAEIPMLDFAIPYAAPRELNTIATLQPIAPKKDWKFVNCS